MSKNHKTNIKCPKCGTVSSFTIWDSINTKIDPEMKDAVLNRSAFLFTCPNCGAKTYTNYSFLYHQMEDQIMIQLALTDKEAEDVNKLIHDDASDMIKTFKEDDYLLRIVRSQEELIEKIRIFDAGLDDRIIEIFKVYVFQLVQENNPGANEILLYFFALDGKNYIQVFVNGQPSGSSEISDELYNQLDENYADELSPLRKDEPFINREWALRKLGLM